MHLNLRLGLIGAGKWGLNYIKTIESIEGIELIKVACKNISPKKKASFSSYELTDDWKKVVASKEIDAIIIATNPAMHYEIASSCIKNGKPIIVEKPLTLSIEDAESLLSLAEKNKINVKVNHIYLYHPAFRLLKKNISKDFNVRSIYSLSGNYGPFRKDVTPLWDWGPHDIAMCLAIMNQFPDKIEAKYIRREISSSFNRSNINIKLFFQDNKFADLNFGNLMKSKTRYFKVNSQLSTFIFDPINNLNIKKETKNKKMEMIDRNSENFLELNQSPLEILLREFSSEIINSRFYLSDLLLSKNVISIIENVDGKLQTNFFP